MTKLNKFLKGLGRGEILVPHLNRWFNQDFTGHPDIPFSVSPDKPKDDAFHPSSHGVGCSRMQFASFDPRVQDRLTAKKFNPKVGLNGHMWHGLLQWVVVEGLGYATWDDVEARYGKYRWAGEEFGYDALRPWREPTRPKEAAWWCTGSVDIANLTVPGRDEKYIVDIKTMQPNIYAMPLPPDNFWHKYQAQTQLYMDWTDTDLCILLCVEAGNPFGFKEIMIERDRDYANYIYEKWNDVSVGLVTGVAPPHSCLDPSKCPSVALYDEEGHIIEVEAEAAV